MCVYTYTHVATVIVIYNYTHTHIVLKHKTNRHTKLNKEPGYFWGGRKGRIL